MAIGLFCSRSLMLAGSETRVANCCGCCRAGRRRWRFLCIAVSDNMTENTKTHTHAGTYRHTRKPKVQAAPTFSTHRPANLLSGEHEHYVAQFRDLRIYFPTTTCIFGGRTRETSFNGKRFDLRSSAECPNNPYP